MTEIDVLWADLEAVSALTQPPVHNVINNRYYCHCGGIKCINQDGIPTCTTCGIVDSLFIDDSPEWSSGVTEDGTTNDSSRCGMAQDTELFSQAWGVGSVMKTNSSSSYKLKKIAKINFHQSMNHKDRSLFHAYKDIDDAAKTRLSIPDNVLRDAKVMYKKISETTLTRGAVRLGIKANCVFYACKLNNIPRTTKEISDAFGIPSRDMSRTSDIFKQIITGKEETTVITRPQHVIQRMINEIKVGEDKRRLRMKALKLSEQLENCVALMGKTPNSIAAVVIYKIFGISKHDVVNYCNISMPTLNKIEIIVNRYLEQTSS